MKKLTGFHLKYLALVLMVLDHIHYMFDFTGKIPIWFSQLGRLSAPLFLFCLVEGIIRHSDSFCSNPRSVLYSTRPVCQHGKRTRKFYRQFVSPFLFPRSSHDHGRRNLYGIGGHPALFFQLL